ncbi:MAG: alpha-L-arabinofuranosidase C-terminal domain-containing protein [Bryobacteraceae bacterium]|jgi:alpha-N-arabinofuranosidase
MRAILAFLCLAAAAFSQQPEARIKIDTERTIGEVHPHLFGNFAEHLGRVIYGGIYEEGSPLSDAQGYRKDTMKAVQELGVSILRWPGGNFVSGYNWKDGIGPKDQRPARPDYAWGGVETNRFGTDEFLQYCERIGVEPYICINAGLGTIEDARNWVEYCNGDRKTYWADQRRKNGREKPYGVKVWGLGNELDGPWQLGHKSAEDYAKFALEAGKAMRWTDPSIKLIASGSSNFGADWIGWNRTVLEKTRDVIDYLSLHTYIGNRENNFEQFLAASQNIEHYIKVTEGLIDAAQSGQRNPRPIYIAYDEWNVWYRARGGGPGVKGLEEIYNYEDALAMGMFFNAFFRHANIVKMANLAQLVNGIAPIFTNKEGLFLQPIYFPIAEYGKQRGNMSLDLLVSSPTYQVPNRPPLGYLDVSGTYNAKDGAVYLNVLNRSEKMDIAARIDNVAGKLDGEVGVWEMSQDDLKATHTFGNDRKVRPTVGTIAAAVDNNGLTYKFPKHSLTILRLRVK